MARVCKTVAGYGTCCAAAMQGLLGKPFTVGPAGKQRCMECHPITKKPTAYQQLKNQPGSPGFRARFVANSVCKIGPGGCQALVSGGPASIAQQAGTPAFVGSQFQPVL